MKNFYLFLGAAMLCFSAQARELSLWIGDTPIADGSTITFNDIEVNTIESDYGPYKEVRMMPDLMLSTDIFSSEITVTAKCTSGQDIQLCAGGNCTAGTSVTKKNVVIQTGEKLKLQFEYLTELDIDQEIPTVTTLIEVQDGDYAETHKSFTIVMGLNAAVTEIEAPADIRFSNAGFEYNVDSPSVFALYTIDGRIALKTTLDGCGTLSTDSLEKGIYIYSFGGKSDKVFIK